MVTAQEMTLFVYNLSLLPIIFFSVLFIILTFIYLLIQKSNKPVYKKLKELPFITVHVPTFNDPIAVRCIKKCMKFDYPKNKYEIIIVDDSTNVKTQKLMKKFAKENPGFIKYIHRNNRHGFKPGALNNAMKITRGEIIAIFDSDWIPKKNFLKTIVKPFSDPKVAIVQTRQGFYNKDKNLITRFAAYLLMIYHTVIMPINNKINCVFFCGTAGAIRRKAMMKVGGWNTGSITEDSDLTVRLLLEGYKTVYIDTETPSEVPDNFEAFVKQQMRWSYGNIRVFIDNFKSILFRKGLTSKQRLMISYVTLGSIIMPMVVAMTFFGFSGWFLGEPELFNFTHVVDMITRFMFTAGFLVMGLITFIKRHMLREYGYLVLSAFTIGLVLAIANSVAFFKAIFNKNLHWFCTPKIDNSTIK